MQYFHWTTWNYIPENRSLLNHCCRTTNPDKKMFCLHFWMRYRKVKDSELVTKYLFAPVLPKYMNS